jgi:hypothetical protein
MDALCAGRPLGITLKAKHKAALIEDGSGDLLDAAICALQACWAARRRNYGLPVALVPAEGWIVSA